MTEQIRKNVFETNSSSSHSLTMSEKDITAQPFSDHVLRQGVIDVTRNEYGWEWHRYYDTQNKLDYLFTQMFQDDSVPNGDPEEVTKELRESSARFDMLCRVVEEHSGVKIQVVPGSTGYIDHDSMGMGMELFDDEPTLRRFLFTNTSYIETGNDNSGPGKTIDTDRGFEDYYQGNYREPKESDVVINLFAKSTFYYSELHTAAGAVLDKENDTAGLFQALCEQATVTAVNIDSRSFYHPFEYGEKEGDTMKSLSASGLYFTPSPDIKVKYTQVKMDRALMRTETVFTMYVPQDLADKLAALEPTPANVANEESAE